MQFCTGLTKMRNSARRRNFPFCLLGSFPQTPLIEKLCFRRRTYCSRIPNGGTRTCQELAAAEKYKAKIADDKAIPIYNRYYKRYAARVRVRQIKEADFKKWTYQTIRLRDDCSAGKISPEEFTQWMEDSFPNRKPKT